MKNLLLLAALLLSAQASAQDSKPACAHPVVWTTEGKVRHKLVAFCVRKDGTASGARVNLNPEGADRWVWLSEGLLAAHGFTLTDMGLIREIKGQERVNYHGETAWMRLRELNDLAAAKMQAAVDSTQRLSDLLNAEPPR